MHCIQKQFGSSLHRPPWVPAATGIFKLKSDLEHFLLLPHSQVLKLQTWATILDSFWLLFLRQILLYSPGCSETHGIPPASASQALDSQVCTTMPIMGFLSSPNCLFNRFA